MIRKDIVGSDFFEVVLLYKIQQELATLMRNHFYQSNLTRSFQTRKRPTVACRPLDCLNFWLATFDSTERTSSKTKEVFHE